MENIASLFVGNFSGESNFSTSYSESNASGMSSSSRSSGMITEPTPTTSRFSVDMTEYVSRLNVKEKRIKKFPSIGQNEKDFSIRDLSEAFAYVEGNEINVNNLVVNHVLMNAKTFSVIRRWGTTIISEPSFREIMNYGIFGNIWTASILVNRQIKDNVIYLISTTSALHTVSSFNSENTNVFKVKFVNDKEKVKETRQANLIIPNIEIDDVLIVKVGSEERPASSEDVEEVRSAIDHVVHSRGKFKAIITHHCVDFVVLKKSALDNSLVGAALQTI